jgi:NADH pyrophosphatase NudC (nudix superfamily)
MESVPKLYHFPMETDSFKIPEFGSQQLLQYINTLYFDDINHEHVLTLAIHNMVLADIEALLPYMQTNLNITDEEKVLNAAQTLVFNRLSNRICDKCGNKHDIKKLSLCRNCGMTWYCSKKCQVEHWPKHIERCCQSNGPVETGYMAMAVLKIDKEKEDLDNKN